MKKNLKISKEIDLPVEVVTQTIAILAKRRAGKSYTMRKICEQLLAADQQLVMVDPKGDQWGIRSSADGKKAGFPIIILGGEHGDLPLEVNAGEVVAKLVVEERVSILLDLSGFRKHEIATFMAIFLESVYRMKALEKNRTPVMLVVDEADAIAPQKPQANEARMLGAIEDIVRRGGQRGIGCALITQRSAVLNKNVLTQAEILVVLRTIAPQDLAAMKAWIEVHGTLEQGKEMMDSLPSLPIGDAWFWSPGWPTSSGIFKRTHILPIETFDSGATPKPGERKVIPKSAADVDLKKLEKQMAATIEKAKAEDPKLLKKEIIRLETELKKKPASSIDEKMKEENALLKKQLEIANKQIDSDKAKFDKFVKDLAKNIDLGLKAFANAPQVFSGDRIYITKNRLKDIDRKDLEKIEPGKVIQIPNGFMDPISPVPNIQAGELAVLKAVGQIEGGITRPHITALTGYKKSTRDRYLITLKSRSYVEDNGGKIYITPAGLSALGPDFEPLPTGPALQDHLMRSLPEGEKKILSALIAAYPDGLERDAITEATGYQKSTRDRYLLYLAAKELVDTSQKGFVIASDKLF